MQKVAITVIIAVLALGAGMWWWVAKDNKQATAQQATIQQHNGSNHDQKAQAFDAKPFETALNSPDQNVQASVMAPELQAAYQQGQSLRSQGAKIQFHPETFQANQNYGTVDASVTLSDGTDNTFKVLLVRQDINIPWRILNTERK